MRPRLLLLPALLVILPLAAQELDRLAPSDAYSTQATPRPTAPAAAADRPAPALTPGRANLAAEFGPTQAARPTPTPVDEPGAPATEPQGFTITLKNLGPLPLPAGAVAEYRVYFRRAVRGENGAGLLLDRLEGSQILGALGVGESTSFQSPIMNIPRSTAKRGFYYYSDGTHTQFKAGAHGVWLRVMQEGKMVYERMEPPGVQADGKW